MRIKLLENYAEYKAGDTFDLTNDVKAKGLISAGLAEAAPAATDGASLIDAETEKAWSGMIASAVRAGIAQGTKSTGKSGAPEGRIDSVETELDGLAVFGSHGGFLYAVKDSAAANPSRDSLEKLASWGDMQRKAGIGRATFETKTPSGNFEANDPDGGALVIPEFSQKIVERMVGKENFLGESDSIIVRGNVLSVPALDDKSRLDGYRSGGVLGAYADEADQLSNVSKVKFRTMDLRLKKLYVFCYMTDELLSDSAYALESYVAGKAADEILFKVNDGFYRGTGGGQPLGFLNSPATISVSKKTGQAAATILTGNIDDMWMRMNAYHRANAVWLINQDCEAVLQSMSLPVGIAGSPTYLPAGGVSAAPYATLKGRPVKVVEWAETLGTVGDISCVDWSAYQSIVKGGVKTDMSMHVRFQYGEMAYRFTYRFDAQPKYDAPLTPYKGSTTTSPFVTLATRA